MSKRATRWLRGYDKVTEVVEIEYPLSEKWELKRLQDLFGVPVNDPMFSCFPVGADEAAALSGAVSGAITLDTHDFFLEADADE